MSDASRLARLSFSAKPSGQPFTHFTPTASDVASIAATVNEAVSDSAYAAIISYAEALSAIQHGSISWSIIKLYYSSFYSLRALLLLNQIVPFNCGGEMLLDIRSGSFLKGGKSSHHWNWGSINRIAHLRGSWFISTDSQDTYGKLREHRENVNYTHCFTDPDFHRCLLTGEADLAKRFRTYRDDGSFLYTYLPDHLAIAYPTKLIFHLDLSLQNLSIKLADEKIAHLRKIWSIKDRCPIS